MYTCNIAHKYLHGGPIKLRPCVTVALHRYDFLTFITLTRYWPWQISRLLTQPSQTRSSLIHSLPSILNHLRFSKHLTNIYLLFAVGLTFCECIYDRCLYLISMVDIYKLEKPAWIVLSLRSGLVWLVWKLYRRERCAHVQESCIILYLL